jgi:hypothetical protein
LRIVPTSNATVSERRGTAPETSVSLNAARKTGPAFLSPIRRTRDDGAAILERVGADQPVLALGPIRRAVRHLLLADDDQDVVVGFVLVRRQRRIDPVAARIAAEENDLENARALALSGGMLGRGAEFVEDDLDDAFKLALLGRGKMIEIGAHIHENLQELRRLWQGQMACCSLWSAWGRGNVALCVPALALRHQARIGRTRGLGISFGIVTRCA